jgi:ADP-heptose:LPS heptosyltransferase
LLGLIRKRSIKHPDTVKRIVVVKLSAIGDTLLLYPALRALRVKYPEAEIIAIATKINREVFSRCKYVDKVISANPKMLMLRPDIAIDFDQWTRLSAILAAATRPGYLIGFSTDGQRRHYAYDLAIPHSRTEHEIECFLKLSVAAGAEQTDTCLEFEVTEIESADVQKFLNAHGVKPKEFVVMHPETPAHGQQRHWPADNFIKLGKKIISDTDKYILLTGTPAEQASNTVIQSAIGPWVICVPPVSLGFIAALFAQSSALVCGNTGIMHLACAMDTPIVALHGPTNPSKWGPRTKSALAVARKSPLQCSPCLYLGFEYGCDNNSCMRAITADAVFENLKNLLQNQS